MTFDTLIAHHGFVIAVGVCGSAILMCVALLFPEWMDLVRAGCRSLIRGFSSQGRRVVTWLRGTFFRSSAITKPVGLRMRPVYIGAAIVMVALPPVVTFMWRDTQVDPYEEGATHLAGAVATVLQGEYLAAPDALPPAIFASRDVELLRPHLAQANRAWERLDEGFTQRLLRIYRLMKERHGYDMALIEGYRSPERQDELAALGHHVTQARAFQSYHQYGLAADSAFLKDGHLVISEKDPWAIRGYQLFGELAEDAGLTWGGRWTFADLGHVEWRRQGKPTSLSSSP